MPFSEKITREKVTLLNAKYIELQNQQSEAAGISNSLRELLDVEVIDMDDEGNPKKHPNGNIMMKKVAPIDPSTRETITNDRRLKVFDKMVAACDKCLAA